MFTLMSEFASFAIGGFVPSAAIAGVFILIGLGAFFYLIEVGCLVRKLINLI